MSIRIYNTLTRQKETFEPVETGKVGMYVCGPTVYAKSHVGHMVGPVLFDTFKRYLQYNGFDVTLVINVTDIDDKIIVQAAKEGCQVDQLAKRVTEDYVSNLEQLDVHVDHFPHATQHIPEILAMIAGLVDKGCAYAAGGDVYFDVTKDSDYGKLSNRKIDELLTGTRKDLSAHKRHPGDFALWKAAKPGEPAWESPWGKGRPGWHIECSAMSMKYLGSTFDIHGGGLDLCFPHHEDEIAQSESLTGQPFAKVWMHNGLMQYSDESRKIGAREGDFSSQEQAKMSKSKGNIVTISELLENHSPETIRFFLLATHYRSPIDFSDTRIVEVGKGLGRLHGFCDRFERITGESFYALPRTDRRADLQFSKSDTEFLHRIGGLRERFLEFMDDDFNTGGAIGVLSELVHDLNRFADHANLEAHSTRQASDLECFQRAVNMLRELTGVLGLLLRAPASAMTEGLTPSLLDLFLEVRQEMRKTKNFAMADLIRDRLAELGVIVHDRPGGSDWEIESSIS